MASATDLIRFIESDDILPEFRLLYGSHEEEIGRQRERYKRLIVLYKERFTDENLSLFSTPGRTEIGGNHTDHNHGRVLAASVNLDSVAIASPVSDAMITVHSEGFEQPFIVNTSDLKIDVKEKGTTTALIRGIASRFKELGHRIGGFHAYISSDVLVGSGLSSSASIEVLIGTILNSFYNGSNISPKELAMIGQYAENNYFGKPCGLMDQTACAVGGIIAIDFNDPQHPDVRKVNFDLASRNYSLLVVDTGGSHADLTDDYASIPTEMKRLANELNAQVARELTVNDIIDNMKALRKKVGDRAILRVLHFLGDNQRVLEQVDTLEQDRFDLFLQLVTESGNSSNKWLQNCYTIKDPTEQGVNLALALSEQYIHRCGHGACRVHGGGFAGTIQVFLHNEHIAGFLKMMQPVFGDSAVRVLNIRSVGTYQFSLNE
ncbi:galactokinase [candidate division KSB1 bacterium]|nr:galactokinase [candidate division KSB1 bacterium]